MTRTRITAAVVLLGLLAAIMVLAQPNWAASNSPSPASAHDVARASKLSENRAAIRAADRGHSEQRIRSLG